MSTELVKVLREEREVRRVARAEEQRVQNLRMRARAEAARAAERWFHGTGADSGGWQANVAELVRMVREREAESRATADAAQQRDEALARTEARLLELQHDYLAERRHRA